MNIHAGLCAGCVHQRIVQSRRGSTFLLCGLSRSDPRFPRYPRLPVLACDGFAARPSAAGHTHSGDQPGPFTEEHD